MPQEVKELGLNKMDETGVLLEQLIYFALCRLKQSEEWVMLEFRK